MKTTKAKSADPVLTAYRNNLKPGESLLGSMAKMIAEAYKTTHKGKR